MTTVGERHNDWVMEKWYNSEIFKWYRVTSKESWFKTFKRRLFNDPYKFDPPVIDLRKYAHGLVDRYRDEQPGIEHADEWFGALEDIIQRVELHGGTYTNCQGAIKYFEHAKRHLFEDQVLRYT